MALGPDEPERQNLGLELMRRSLPYDLGGTTELVFRPEGIRFTLTIPLVPGVLADKAA